MQASAQIHFRWSWLVILFAAALIALPDIGMACGNHGQHRHHGDPGANENDSQGRSGHRWHHHRGPGEGGDVDVEVGVGSGDGGPGDYGVPGGRIGPPTRACAEAQHLRAELNRTLTLRRAAESGRRVLMPGSDGGYTVVNAARYRREHEQALVLNGRSAGQSAADIVQLQKAMDEARDTTLRVLDSEISDIQNRLGQLDYECR